MARSRDTLGQGASEWAVSDQLVKQLLRWLDISTSRGSPAHPDVTISHFNDDESFLQTVGVGQR